jgi:uncharacterized protein with FMN-binding domain
VNVTITRPSVRIASGIAAAMSIATVVAPAAHAADATDGERGTAPADVDAALWTEATKDPAVVTAYAKYLKAQTAGQQARDAAKAAQAAVRRAHRTPDGRDDRRARAALAHAHHAAEVADNDADDAKEAWDTTIGDRLAVIEHAHGGGAPAAAAAGATGPVDGTYAGKPSRKNPFGDIQVTITVAGGKITACSATFPTASQSGTINNAAVPTLCSEAVAAQSATIASVGGASYTSPAFKESLADAVRKAGL